MAVEKGPPAKTAGKDCAVRSNCSRPLWRADVCHTVELCGCSMCSVVSPPISESRQLYEPGVVHKIPRTKRLKRSSWNSSSHRTVPQQTEPPTHPPTRPPTRPATHPPTHQATNQASKQATNQPTKTYTNECGNHYPRQSLVSQEIHRSARRTWMATGSLDYMLHWHPAR